VFTGGARCVNLAYVWQRWGTFLAVLAALAHRRCPVVVLASSQFYAVGEALS
jgi:hypothetical protein